MTRMDGWARMRLISPTRIREDPETRVKHEKHLLEDVTVNRFARASPNPSQFRWSVRSIRVQCAGAPSCYQNFGDGPPAARSTDRARSARILASRRSLAWATRTTRRISAAASDETTHSSRSLGSRSVGGRCRPRHRSATARTRTTAQLTPLLPAMPAA